MRRSCGGLRSHAAERQRHVALYQALQGAVVQRLHQAPGQEALQPPVRVIALVVKRLTCARQAEAARAAQIAGRPCVPSLRQPDVASAHLHHRGKTAAPSASACPPSCRPSPRQPGRSACRGGCWHGACELGPVAAEGCSRGAGGGPGSPAPHHCLTSTCIPARSWLTASCSATTSAWPWSSRISRSQLRRVSPSLHGMGGHPSRAT